MCKQRPKGEEGKGVPGRSKDPKVGRCLADMGTHQEASVAGLGEMGP